MSVLAIIYGIPFHDCAACVVLQTQGGIVVLNGEDEASTEEMYQTLQERIR